MSDQSPRRRYRPGSVESPAPRQPLHAWERARWTFQVHVRFGTASATADVARALLSCLSLEGICCPGYARLGELARRSEPSVERAIKALKAAGLLNWMMRRVKADQATNGYVLLLPEPESDPADPAPEPDIVVTAPVPPAPLPEPPLPSPGNQTVGSQYDEGSERYSVEPPDGLMGNVLDSSSSSSCLPIIARKGTSVREIMARVKASMLGTARGRVPRVATAPARLSAPPSTPPPPGATAAAPQAPDPGTQSVSCDPPRRFEGPG